jgi:hypothetical protein
MGLNKIEKLLNSFPIHKDEKFLLMEMIRRYGEQQFLMGLDEGTYFSKDEGYPSDY